MKNKWIALVLVTFMAFGLVGCGNSAKVVEKIELGASCLEQGDYQGAIAAYEEAINLDKYAWDAYEGMLLAKAEIGTSEVELEEIVGTALTELQNSYANNKVSEEDVESVLGLVNVSIQVLPSNNIIGDILDTANKIFDEDTWQSNFTDKVEEMAWEAVSKGDADAALNYAEMLGSESYGKDSIIQNANQIKESQKEAQAFVEKYVTAVENKDWETVKTMNWGMDLENAIWTLSKDMKYTFKEGERAGKVLMTAFEDQIMYYGEESGSGILFCSKELWDDSSAVFYFEGTWNNLKAQSGHQYLSVGDKVWLDRDVTVVNGEVFHDGSDDAQYYLSSVGRYVSGGANVSDFDEYTLRGAGILQTLASDVSRYKAVFVVWEKIDIVEGEKPYMITIEGNNSGYGNHAAALEESYGTDADTGNATGNMEATYDEDTGTISIQGGFTFGD